MEFEYIVCKSTMKNGFLHIPNKIRREMGISIGDTLKISVQKVNQGV